jgi:hypothetical protein
MLWRRSAVPDIMSKTPPATPAVAFEHGGGMRRFVGAGLLVGLLALVGAAQDGPVTIKMRKGEVGDVTRKSHDNTFTMQMSVTTRGQTQDRNETKSVKIRFTDEVLTKAAGAKKPTTTKRTLLSTEATEDGSPKQLDLTGKTLFITTAERKTTYKFDTGGELSESQLKFLNAGGGADAKDKPDFDELMIPKQPVKVGESWKIDATSLAKDFDDHFEFDGARSGATGKLTKVYEREGRKFGVLEIKIHLVASKFRERGQAVPLKDGSKVLIEANLDVCIDGTAEAGAVSTTMKANFEGETAGRAMKLAMRGKNTQTAEPVK